MRAMPSDPARNQIYMAQNNLYLLVISDAAKILPAVKIVNQYLALHEGA